MRTPKRRRAWHDKATIFLQLPCTTPPSLPRPHAAPCSALCCAPALLCACSAALQRLTPRAKKPNKTPAPAPRPKSKSSTTAALPKKPPPSATGACTANAGVAPTPAPAWVTRGAKTTAERAGAATCLCALASARTRAQYQRHVFQYF